MNCLVRVQHICLCTARAPSFFVSVSRFPRILAAASSEFFFCVLFLLARILVSNSGAAHPTAKTRDSVQVTCQPDGADWSRREGVGVWRTRTGKRRKKNTFSSRTKRFNEEPSAFSSVSTDRQADRLRYEQLGAVDSNEAPFRPRLPRWRLIRGAAVVFI